VYPKSQKLFLQAEKIIPGGVNSPVRAMKTVMDQPIFIERAKGSRVYDVDGNSYIDYVGSWGPLILGHAHPQIIEIIAKTAANGTSFGAPTALENEMAALIVEALPAVEMVRMVNSGTEAVMSALRVARGYTGRSKIIKFAGCYHGHCDSFLIKAGSGAATLGCPDSPGVTEGTAGDTIIVPYNDLDAVKEALELYAGTIAAVIVEPIAGNMGLVLPQEGFLEGLRDLTSKNGVLLIFDEVISGFRVGYGGAQEYYQIKPDLTTLGKIIGGGLPVGAYGGRREIMEQVAPCGPVYQAGTLSGNPLAMAVGIETLKILKAPGFYEKLNAKREKLTSGLAKKARDTGISIQLGAVGSMFGTFFNLNPVKDFAGAILSDSSAFKIYFLNLLKQGIYIAPSQFETGFVSAAHNDEDIEITVTAVGQAFQAVSNHYEQH